MIRYAQQMTQEHRNHMRGGEGIVTLQPLYQKGDFQSQTRLFSRITLLPGVSVGYHTHEGEEEFYYILTGTAEYNDNGTICTIGAGDATVATSGQGHAIRNAGDSPLELIAVIELV